MQVLHTTEVIQVRRIGAWLRVSSSAVQCSCSVISSLAQCLRLSLLIGEKHHPGIKASTCHSLLYSLQNEVFKPMHAAEHTAGVPTPWTQQMYPS